MSEEQQSLFPEVKPVKSFKEASKDPTTKRKVTDKKTGEVKEVVTKYNIISEPGKHRLQNTFFSAPPTDASPEEWLIVIHRLLFWCRTADDTIKDLTKAYREMKDMYLDLANNVGTLATNQQESYNRILNTIEKLALAEGESEPQ